MKTKKDNSFWPSYTDLMTSLFFIMLVLYVLTYVRLNSTIKLQKEKLAIIEAVEQNLKPLKQDTLLFKYEKEYKRFVLAFKVKFHIGAEIITPETIDTKDPLWTISQIDEAGKKLLQTVNNLELEKRTNPSMKDVSYLLIISGNASNLISEIEFDEYQRSYHRAWNLWSHWKEKGIDFEDKKYNGLIDLQIAGNGWGGVGRYERDPQNNFSNELNNQRFIIQIVPKIGNTN
jgi:hypothetical protein